MAVINVDCSKPLGRYTKTYVNNNWCDWFHFPETYYADMEFMSGIGILLEKFRIWLNPKGWYSFEHGTYRFEHYYRYLEGASRTAERIVIDTGSPLKGVELIEYKIVLKAGLKHYKQAFSQNRIYRVFKRG